ncbi:MAG TPA: FG-GAP repeat protein [Candidatus Angelobacter sp.]|nr:FG-GAP repeat protein [Candidatus Angelobacter sp.]
MMGTWTSRSRIAEIAQLPYCLGTVVGRSLRLQGSPYAVSQGPSAIMAADFNGDGKLDLAVAARF